MSDQTKHTEALQVSESERGRLQQDLVEARNLVQQATEQLTKGKEVVALIEKKLNQE